jgi:tripartite-type tricarboxylate transporter receptor subunit TctC
MSKPSDLAKGLLQRGRSDVMKIPRRRFLSTAILSMAAGAAVAPVLPRRAWALEYPTRPVRLIIGFAPGGPADIVARLIGQRLSERLGQPFVIESRPGAGTTIATEAVVRSAPDGYTLLWTTSADEINATLYTKLNYNYLRDIAPIANIDLLPLVLEVNPSFPVKTVPEFIAYAKANPGKVNFATGGIGSSQHVAGELFKFMTGVDLVHVPYRGAALAVADVIAGQVQATFSPIPLSVGYIRAGKLRALAVTSTFRSAALPDIPTIGDFVPGYEAIASDGLAAPANTPADIIAKLNAEVNAALTDPAIKARLEDLGGVATPMSVSQFREFIAKETDKWAKVIKFANIKAE